MQERIQLKHLIRSIHHRHGLDVNVMNVNISWLLSVIFRGAVHEKLKTTKPCVSIARVHPFETWSSAKPMLLFSGHRRTTEEPSLPVNSF